MRERESVVPEHAGDRRQCAAFAGGGDAAGIHEALCGGQREEAGGAADERRFLVGIRNEVFWRATVARMGDGAEDCAYCSPSGAADDNAADAGARLAQQLRSDGGYWRAHAEPRPDDLRLPQLESVARWGSGRRSKSTASGRRGQSRDRAPGEDKLEKNALLRNYSGLVMTPQAMRGGAPLPVPPVTA